MSDTTYLLDKIDELAGKNASLREEIRHAKESVKQAERERDAAFEREDAIVARAMQLGHFRDPANRRHRLTLDFDDELLRMARDWKSLFFNHCQTMADEVNAYLLKPVAAAPSVGGERDNG